MTVEDNSYYGSVLQSVATFDSMHFFCIVPQFTVLLPTANVPGYFRRQRKPENGDAMLFVVQT